MTDQDELRPEVFHKFEIFDGLTAEELGEITHCAELLAVEPEVEIMTEGVRDRDLYGLLSGRAEVLTTDDDGQRRKLAELTPYAIVGELGLAVGAPRSATVRTLESSRLLQLDGAEFHELQTAHKSVAYKVEHNILRILARRIGQMNREVFPLGED